MQDLTWKAAASHIAAIPSDHWHRSSFVNAENAGSMPCPGHSFDQGVRIQQSASPQLQTKLRVSHPSDTAEAEADRVADSIMQMPDPTHQAAREAKKDESVADILPKCTECATSAAETEKKETASEEKKVESKAGEEEQVARKVEEEEETPVARKTEDEEEVARKTEDDEEVARKTEDEEAQDVQTKSNPQAVPVVTPKLESQIKSAHSSGTSLSKKTRGFFEPRFGADFSDVRVHTGPQASYAARQLNAKAFTVGNKITFGEGDFSPESHAGKQLLAHELTHVVQQCGRKS